MNEVPTADSGPGFLAFVAFFVLALALWFLMRNMNARMRRMSYRQQAAHRGKDDPQVGPGDVEIDDPAPQPGEGPVVEGDATPPDAEPDGEPGGGPRERDGS
jgi:hypothetical protein